MDKMAHPHEKKLPQYIKKKLKHHVKGYSFQIIGWQENNSEFIYLFLSHRYILSPLQHRYIAGRIEPEKQRSWAGENINFFCLSVTNWNGSPGHEFRKWVPKDEILKKFGLMVSHSQLPLKSAEAEGAQQLWKIRQTFIQEPYLRVHLKKKLLAPVFILSLKSDILVSWCN